MAIEISAVHSSSAHRDRTEPPRSPHWPATRARHLEREPACAACGETDRAVLQVHHISPFHEEPTRELDDGSNGSGRDGNLVTLCERPGVNHHLWLGHHGNFKLSNPHVRADAAAELARQQHLKGAAA